MQKLHFSMLRSLYNFQEKTYIPDGFGGHGEAWQDTYMAWCRLEPIIPDKKSQGIKAAHPWTHRLYTRFTTKINNHMRLQSESGVFNVDRIINVDEKFIFLQIMLIKVENE